ncbi:Outer membrane cobalamin receptor protein [Sphingobacterium nematocida]|uniref:Outer membrane cobalamin receptor protein n=1 Tax=Sphingobacterium nematocida TaxID=1513896 RepID=A0A1T5D9H4_9SPHI|nr:TonB-dependent receptor [Sphingobacterium nematocida]SKB68428.1 Outer membrane cobalamin receptor protein [Sphingobacterium nematocida]
MLNLRWGLMLLFTIGILSTNGQGKSVEGVVRSTDKKVIAGVGVKIVETGKQTTTDTKGRFSFKALETGSYNLQVQAVGYDTLRKRVTVVEGQNLFLDLLLLKRDQEIETVDVSGKSKAQEIKSSGFNVNVIETKAYANTNSDINQILNRSAGVRVSEQGGLGSNFNFSLNGLSGNHIKFFIDGVPLESMGAGLTFNNIPVNIVERIEVYKGVVPAYLGSDALGGAVNLVTNKDRNKFMDLSYSLGSFNTHRSALSSGYKDPKTGLTLNLNAYYNYSDNNYKMRTNPKAGVFLEVPLMDDKGNYTSYDTLSSARRFHDSYYSYMTQLEAGVRDKQWADVAVLGFTYAGTDKDIQTGATQDRPRGMVDTKTKSYTPNIRYRKDRLFIDGLSATMYGNLAYSNTIITDTSSFNTYTWTGAPVDLGRPYEGELGSRKSRQHQKNNNLFGQANLMYTLSPKHVFTLNHNINSNQREAYDEIDPYDDYYSKTNRMVQQVTGLNYQQLLLDKRLHSSFFGKRYGVTGKVKIGEAGSSLKTTDYYGYGAAVSYKIWESIVVKGSYERSFRLPSFIELHGDGVNVDASPKLQPENSDNFNISLNYNLVREDHQFSFDGNVFYRNARNYIVNKTYQGLQGSRRYSSNENGVKVNGADTEVRYLYRGGLFRAQFNLSYYNAIDREKYDKGTDRIKMTYKNRTPNEPWLYGNADLSTFLNRPFGVSDGRLYINYYLQFVNSYSLGWSKLAKKTSEDYIPEQWLHNLALTYSLADNKYNITFEGRNLTDEIAYDTFKLQKPGRAFSIKLRYLISYK